jgi:two-component system, OmpR family, response regulator RegX3
MGPAGCAPYNRAMRIALLEDDPHQADRITRLLEDNGDVVHAFSRGRALLSKLAHESYDVILIDWEVPDLSGYDVLRSARGELLNQTPVLFLTHRDSEENIVQALEAGADDYLVKPHRDRELLARLQALARRGRSVPAGTIDVPPYRIDIATARILRGGEPVTLTRREYQLGLFLFQNLGKVVSRAHLLESILGVGEAVTTRTVDTHVSRLRFALGLSAQSGVRLTPVYGYGYRLEVVQGSP